jgi:hypothetical protein
VWHRALAARQNRNPCHATAPWTPSVGRASMNLPRPDASSTRSWLISTGSSGEDREPHNPQPTPQPVPVREQHCEGDGERQEHRLAAEQSRARASTPPARGHERDNNQRANEGVNVNANTDGDALPLFRRASQNLAAAAMLLCVTPAF